MKPRIIRERSLCMLDASRPVLLLPVARFVHLLIWLQLSNLFLGAAQEADRTVPRRRICFDKLVISLIRYACKHSTRLDEVLHRYVQTLN